MRFHVNKTVKAAVDRVDCDNRTDFLQLWKQPSGEELCFANAGDLPVAVYGVTYLNSGNNAGYVRVNRNGSVVQVNFLKDQRNVDVSGDVIFIHVN